MQNLQILRNDSRTVLRKIFQHNARNNDDFIVQTVSETCSQCVCHSFQRHTPSDRIRRLSRRRHDAVELLT